MKMIRVLVFALAAACGPGEQKHMHGWAVDQQSLASPLPNTQGVLRIVREQAFCPIPDEQWGGIVFFMGSYRVAGLNTWWSGDVPRLFIATIDPTGAQLTTCQSALAHEALHVAQMMCGITPYHEDWSVAQRDQFYDALARVRAQAASEGICQ